jgi:hypothetical protein
MSYFIRNGSSFRVSSDEALDIHKKLPVGNYIVKVDEFGNFFLDSVDSFPVVPKLYGDVQKNAKRILNTFVERGHSTGIMLNGEKGSGKTLLAKVLSNTAASELQIPTIIINHPFVGDPFNKFIQDIDQPCIVMFDEFEKVYDDDHQEGALTLLDGVYPSKKLFILTCNDKWRVNQHMRNRPGRIFYMMEFGGLSAEFIREYCDENLDNKTHTDKIVRITNVFDAFNFDMLKALVEEMNRYSETPMESLKMLNIKPEGSSRSGFKVEMLVDGIVPEQFDKEWGGNPLNETVRIDYKMMIAPPQVQEDPPLRSSLRELKISSATRRGIARRFTANQDMDDAPVESQWREIQLNQNDLSRIDNNGSRYVFVKENVTVTLTREINKDYNWMAV